MTIFWKTVCYLEQIDLHVIVATADGASLIVVFFRMYKYLQGASAVEDVIYRAKNIHSKDNPFIYLFGEVPHTIKTARNCLSNSGSGRATRYL